jgi:DNA primase
LADFATIKAQVSMAQVIDMLGITGLTEHGETLRGFCPICKEGNNRAFVVTPARNIFYCFSEKKGGSVIDLVARMKRIPEAQAGQQIAAHFGLNGTTQGAGKPADNAPGAADGPQERKSSGFDPREYQRSLDSHHEALTGLGISPATIRAFGGGYAAKGVMRGRLALPICRTDGEITGFMGVAINGETPEILYPKGYTVPFLFGVQRVEAGVLYLVNHPLDALRATDGGMENVIASLTPITPDVLTSLQALMRDKDAHTLELM